MNALFCEAIAPRSLHSTTNEDMKGILIYKGKYGATDQYAEWIAAALRIPAFTESAYKAQKLITYDYVVIGSSVYMGKLLLRDWLRENILYLKNKKLYLYIVCGTPADQEEKLDKIVRDNLPAELRGYCTVYFMRGRMTMKKLNWKDKLIVRLGALMAKTPAEKKALVTDFDAVQKENITPLTDAVNALQSGKRKSPADEEVMAE